MVMVSDGDGDGGDGDGGDDDHHHHHVYRRSGDVLGGLGPLRGSSWAPPRGLGCSWDLLDRSWGVLGLLEVIVCILFNAPRVPPTSSWPHIFTTTKFEPACFERFEAARSLADESNIYIYICIYTYTYTYTYTYICIYI